MGSIDWLYEIPFFLRRNVLGRVRLKRGLPAIAESEALRNEHAFYSLLLQRAPAAIAETDWNEVWDIGCRSWSYARALAGAFPAAKLVGVEVDGGRRMADLHRRSDYVKAYAQELKRGGREVETHFSDFRRLPGLARGPALYCAFFPFVSERPCRKWGLPARFARFEELLEKIARGHSQGVPYGILSVHQGEWEAELARKTYSSLKMQVIEIIVENHDFSGLWPNAFDVHMFAKIC